MANTFKSAVAKDVGISQTALLTVGTGKVATLIGCTVSNTTASQITCDVILVRASIDYYIIKGAYIPVGSAFIWTGGDQKVVAMAGDVIKVATSATASADAILSYLEIA